MDRFVALIDSLKKRGPMYVCPFTYAGLVAFVDGYITRATEQASVDGFAGMTGFRDWLIMRIPDDEHRDTNLGWQGIIWYVFGAKEDRIAIEEFFELSTAFLADRKERGISAIRKEYQAWHVAYLKACEEETQREIREGTI